MHSLEELTFAEGVHWSAQGMYALFLSATEMYICRDDMTSWITRCALHSVLAASYQLAEASSRTLAGKGQDCLLCLLIVSTPVGTSVKRLEGSEKLL